MPGIPDLPVTGFLWYDAGLAVGLLIVGVLIGLKAENKLGWGLCLLAVVWGYLLFNPLT